MGIRFLKASVFHGRYGAVKNRFCYRQSYIELSLTDLDQQQPWWFGVNRFSIFSFYNRDHGDRKSGNLFFWAKQQLQTLGQDASWVESITLITHPRVLGFVFNPVSFWHLKDNQGHVRSIFAEVNNTFSKTHTYVLMRRDGTPITKHHTFHGNKVFHVSPFYRVQGHYRFRFFDSSTAYKAHITYTLAKDPEPHDDNASHFCASHFCASHFCASLSGTYDSFSLGVALGHLFKTPLGALKTVVLISFQALKLFKKGVKFKKSDSKMNHTVSLIQES